MNFERAGFYIGLGSVNEVIFRFKFNNLFSVL